MVHMIYMFCSAHDFNEENCFVVQYSSTLQLLQSPDMQTSSNCEMQGFCSYDGWN